MAECLQCGRPGEEGGTEGCGRVGFPGAPLEPNAGVEKSPRHPSCRVRGGRCLCCALPAGEGRCPWCLLGRVSQRGRCPCPYAGHGKLLGVVVVSGKRRRAVFWEAGGSGRLLELDEARKGCVVECGVKLGNASAGVRGAGLARAERELGVAGSTFGWRSVVVMVAPRRRCCTVSRSATIQPREWPP